MSYTPAKLKELGYTLETVDLNAGRLMLATRTGNLVYTSGSVSRFGGKETMAGSRSADLTVEQG